MAETKTRPELNPSFRDGPSAAAIHVVQPVNRFLHTEAASGIVLVTAAVVALVWANTPWADAYHELIETHITLDLAVLTLDESILHWINDLLMAFFFFVAGLEIKRELVHGDLRDPRRALLPIAAALGGMVVPAALYALVTIGGEGARGWGIPMATDIAFAVGILALVGRRAPASLKVFLLTLAIVDDIGAILVIAVFYTDSLAIGWLGMAVAVVAAILLLRRLRVKAIVPYVVLAGALWLAVFESGVHATIAGVVLGLLTPAWPLQPPEAVTGHLQARVEGLRRRAADGVGDESEQTELSHIAELAVDGVSPLFTWERRLHPWTSFVVLPLFAFANAGVELTSEGVGGILGEPIALGIILGLVVGKPLGVLVAAWGAVRLADARLPRGVGWLELGGVGLLAGVGFTVSIFIAGLAFADAALTDTAKIGILAASVLAGVLGYATLSARRTTSS